jgi:putative ABC transport system permease protein
MLKNKVFVLINIFGLAIAIGCSIVAYFNWQFDVQFDSNHANRNSVYRVSMVNHRDGWSRNFSVVPQPLAEVIKQNIPDVPKVARITWSWTNLKVKNDLFPGGLAYVDPTFFELFSFEFIRGSVMDISNKQKIFISDKMAIKLFGSIDVVGASLQQVFDSELKELEVGGVFKSQPENSSFQETAYINYDGLFDEIKKKDLMNWNENTTLFIQVDQISQLSAIEKELQKYVANINSANKDIEIDKYVLDPFHGMAQYDAVYGTMSQTRPASNRAAVTAPLVMALLILLLACFNLTNTTIALASRRLKEIGIRKVMGSSRKQLIIQFFVETGIICFISLGVGLFLGELFLDSWNALWPKMKLASHYYDNIEFILFIFVLLLFTTAIAGGYPAIYISHFQPISILKDKLKFGGTNFFTRGLLGLQFTISLIAIVVAFAFYENANFQNKINLGFDKDGVIITTVSNGSEYEAYRNVLLQNGNITAIGSTRNNFFIPNPSTLKSGIKQIDATIIEVGENYLTAMGLTIISGRDFDRNLKSDMEESVIITKKLAARFGWDNPIGKEIFMKDTSRFFVIGVVEDIYSSGLWHEMQPILIRQAEPQNYFQLIVRAPVSMLSEINSTMEMQWKKVFPNRLYNGYYVNQMSVESDTVNKSIVNMFSFLGGIAMLLSATGLFTLVSLTIVKRMKEIGVRRVLGASVTNIARLINTEFFIILFIASAVGSLIGFFVVNFLMNSIWDYFLPGTKLTLILSSLLMFVISLASVGYKVYAAASSDPAKILRDQ